MGVGEQPAVLSAGDTLGTGRTACPGKRNLGAGVHSRSSWEGCFYRGQGDLEQKTFHFFLDLFIPSLFLKRCYSHFSQRTYAKRSGS